MGDSVISVIMSVYNEPIGFVDQAIKSILNQTFTEIELIVVLDNPGYDNMKQFLQTVLKQDERIYLIINDNNIGLAASLNRGIEIARGKYIARMDADDISKPERLAHELAYIESKDLDLVSCLAEKIDDANAIMGSIPPLPESLQFIREILPIHNVIIHPTVLMKAEIIRKLNGYRLFSTCQDYDLWLRMLTSGYKMGIMNEYLFYFRRHKNSITASRRFIQVLNESYIRQLYKERCKRNGLDSFTYDKMKNYLIEHNSGNAKKLAIESRYYKMYQKGLNLMKKRSILAPFLILASFRSYTARKSLETSLKARNVKRKFACLL
ncbi:MAG: glycosyltransferase [Prevotella sp.]|nr:glycosyltransferase [Prevotella sp.]